MSKLTPGKLAGLKAVSDSRGVIAAAAMDQRGSLQKSLAKERGAAADAHDLEQFKIHVTEVLTRHASAILLDPEFGLPASKERNKAGLLLAYEKTGYDAATPGRLPDLLDVWSVRRLKEAGADCIKILLYYTPFEKTPVNDLKPYVQAPAGFTFLIGDPSPGAESAEERVEIFKAGGAQFYADIRDVNVHEKGGHFGPYENPEAWIHDLRQTYRELR